MIPCTRPERLAEVLAPLAEAAAGVVEVAVAGDVAEVDPGALPVPVTLVPVAERHSNVRRNAALARTTAPVVAFLDDDASPRPGWLDAALAVEPHLTEVVTGPEVPTRSSRGAAIGHAVLSLRIAEGSRAHVWTVAGPVHWSEVPFCNCVVPRALFALSGPPAEDVPWDADDFDLFRRVAPHATFRNDPRLLVAHDRYPDRLRDLVVERAATRVRTGEKLVELWELYRRVPSLAAAAVAGPCALVVVAGAGRRRRRLVLAGSAAYAAVLVDAARRLRRQGVRTVEVPRAVALLVTLHGLTAVAVPIGVARAVTRAGRGPGRRGDQDPARDGVVASGRSGSDAL